MMIYINFFQQLLIDITINLFKFLFLRKIEFKQVLYLKNMKIFIGKLN